MLAAALNHLAVDIDQNDLLDAFVLERLVGDGEVAAAHDHHPLDPPVLQHRQMGQHLGIGGFVAAGQLDDVVEHQHPAVGDAVENLNALEAAFLVHQRLGLELHDLGVTLVQTLFEGVWHRGSSWRWRKGGGQKSAPV